MLIFDARDGPEKQKNFLGSAWNGLVLTERFSEWRNEFYSSIMKTIKAIVKAKPEMIAAHPEIDFRLFWYRHRN